MEEPRGVMAIGSFSSPVKLHKRQKKQINTFEKKENYKQVFKVYVQKVNIIDIFIRTQYIAVIPTSEGIDSECSNIKKIIIQADKKGVGCKNRKQAGNS